MRIPFRLVDVFTNRPLAGNQLCVVPDPIEISSELMQAVAREIGFSETTFVTRADGDRYAMRIFTPGSEMPFAGHPSLGTAFVLVSEGRVGSPAVQAVVAGEFRMEVDIEGGTAWMNQLAPSFLDTEERDVAEVVGLVAEDLDGDHPLRVVSTGLPHLMVAVTSDEAVRRARPDPEPLEDILGRAGADGYYLFHFDQDRAEAHARMFAPGVGVLEDPATGSAAGPLGAHLAELGLLPGGRLTISQGGELGRPSTLLVEAARTGEGWTVRVGGGVSVVGAGAFELPG